MIDSMKRQALTILVTLAPVVAVPHPLTDATRQALRACDAVEAPSIEECRNKMGRSAAISEARRRAGVLFQVRADFQRTCTLGAERCSLAIDRLMYLGFDLAGSSDGIPRSDMRR